MKKLVLATVLALSAQFALANTVKDQVDPQFQKVEAMVKANNFKGAYDALNQLASQGNAQALYNLGYLTQTGQGTTKDEKKAIQLYEQAASKGYPVAICRPFMPKPYMTSAAVSKTKMKNRFSKA